MSAIWLIRYFISEIILQEIPQHNLPSLRGAFSSAYHAICVWFRLLVPGRLPDNDLADSIDINRGTEDGTGIDSAKRFTLTAARYNHDAVI